MQEAVVKIRMYIAMALLLAWSHVAAAHPLAVGTSRITLRDAHIEVQAEWDLFALVPESPTTVATLTEAELATWHRRVQQDLLAQTRLAVDGHVLPLQVTAVPQAVELQAMAAQLSATQQAHGPLVRLRLESNVAVPHARDVALTVPQGLGPTLTSFVQPAAQMTVPGDAAHFAVLAPQPASLPQVSKVSAPPQAAPSQVAAGQAPFGQPWWRYAALAAALACAATWMLGRTGKSTRRTT